MNEIVQLVESITAKAQEEVRRIDNERDNEVARIREETEELAHELEGQLMHKARQLRDSITRQATHETIARAEAEALACKNALLEETFASMRTSLPRLPKKERERLLREQWEHVIKTMQVEEVDVSRHDAWFFARKANIRTRTDDAGGFVAYTRKRTISYDARFETLLDEVHRRGRGDIAKALFNDSATIRRKKR